MTRIISRLERVTMTRTISIIKWIKYLIYQKGNNATITTLLKLIIVYKLNIRKMSPLAVYKYIKYTCLAHPRLSTFGQCESAGASAFIPSPPMPHELRLQHNRYIDVVRYIQKYCTDQSYATRPTLSNWWDIGSTSKGLPRRLEVAQTAGVNSMQ